MGKPLTNENIYEQYVDAAFFMDQYALTLQEKLEAEPKTEVETPRRPPRLRKCASACGRSFWWRRTAIACCGAMPKTGLSICSRPTD